MPSFLVELSVGRIVRVNDSIIMLTRIWVIIKTYSKIYLLTIFICTLNLGNIAGVRKSAIVAIKTPQAEEVKRRPLQNSRCLQASSR